MQNQTNTKTNTKPKTKTMLRHHADPTTLEYGIDEVARGCLFGRVYAGAVVWKHPSQQPADALEPVDLPKHVVIRDSKTMSKAQRERADEWIRNNAYAVAISYKDETHIDDHNILQSAQEAMCDALCETRRIVQQHADYDANLVEHALVDGNTFRPSTPSPVHHTCVVKGDSKYFAIACAAIVAKVAHDRYIAELCEKHPLLNERYGLLKNMGYGTKKHLDGIKEFGVTSMHRRSFGCCRGKGVTMMVGV
jgi:ribonuclease HII